MLKVANDSELIPAPARRLRWFAPLTSAELRPILFAAVAIWVGTSIFWAVPSILEDGSIPERVLLGMLFDFALGLSLSALMLWTNLRLLGRPAWLRSTSLVLMVGTFAVFHAYVDAEVMTALEAAYGFPQAPILKIFGSVLIDFLLIYVLFATAVGLLLSQYALRQRDLRLAHAETAAERAQLAALRHQLNPHFMFNTLNAIGSLIASGRGPQAEEMIDRLSDFMRAALAQDSGPLHALGEELATIGTYLDIERVRFGDRLRVAMRQDPDTDSLLVPSFMLQPLVENAVKHAVGPSFSPVSLTVTAERGGAMLCLTVEDQGADTGSGGTRPPGTATGLRNLRERLALLYGDQASLEAGPTAGGFRASVRLPVAT